MVMEKEEIDPKLALALMKREICLKCANCERKRRGEPPGNNFQINIF